MLSLFLLWVGLIEAWLEIASKWYIVHFLDRLSGRGRLWGVVVVVMGDACEWPVAWTAYCVPVWVVPKVVHAIIIIRQWNGKLAITAELPHAVHIYLESMLAQLFLCILAASCPAWMDDMCDGSGRSWVAAVSVLFVLVFAMLGLLLLHLLFFLLLVWVLGPLPFLCLLSLL